MAAPSLRLRSGGFAGGRDESDQGVGEFPTGEDTEEESGGGEERGFGEDLGDEAAARGTESAANGEFVEPAADTGEDEQAGVDGAEEHHERAQRFEREQRLAVLAAQAGFAGAPGFEGELIAAAEEMVIEDFVLRVGFVGDERGGSGESGLRGGEGLARLEAAHDGEPEGAGLIDHGERRRVKDSVEGERDQDVVVAVRGDSIKTRRQDADDADGGVLGAEDKGAAEDVRIGVEVRAPEVVHQEGFGLEGLILFARGLGEAAAENRMEFEDAEDAAGGEFGVNGFGGAVVILECDVVIVGGEDASAGLVGVQSLIEDVVEVDVAIGPGGEGVAHERAGMRDGEALEEDGVGQQKDGGVGADAEGQGDEGDDRIAWGFAELAQRVAKILSKREHRIPPEVELTGYRLQESRRFTRRGWLPWDRWRRRVLQERQRLKPEQQGARASVATAMTGCRV